MEVIIRKAEEQDFEEIFNLIIELANFEKLEAPDNDAKTRLYNEAFSNKPLFNIILAEVDSIISGYAFYFFTYSSFLALKTLYLEDIFITESKRNLGIGKLLFNELVNISREENCGRMEWSVLDWNQNAISFYNKIGARPLNEWIHYRLSVES